MAYITAENVSVGYENKKILKDVNFTVNRGDYLCIVGENGSGKTTLMKTILGLLQPLSGEIRFGDDLKKTEIGYLPQQTVIQRDFPASVEEIVISGCQGRLGIRPFYNKKEKELAVNNMKKMHIMRIRKQCYRELSGGQQQRVLLARALCATQKLLLLDEPVAGLDPKVTAGMYELIDQLNREGITIIMISHDISSALRYATHILHVGNKIFFGTKEDYLGTGNGRDFLIQAEPDEPNYDDFNPDELEMPEFIRPEMIPKKTKPESPETEAEPVAKDPKENEYLTAHIVFADPIAEYDPEKAESEAEALKTEEMETMKAMVEMEVRAAMDSINTVAYQAEVDSSVEAMDYSLEYLGETETEEQAVPIAVQQTEEDDDDDIELVFMETNDDEEFSPFEDEKAFVYDDEAVPKTYGINVEGGSNR